MNENAEQSAKLPGMIRRKRISASSEQLIREKYLDSGRSLPLVLYPAIDGVNIIAWIEGHQAYISENLSKHGGILLRNFTGIALAEFEQLISIISTELMVYHEGASPRTQISNNVYTSTDYPANESIFLHNELAYRQVFPLKIFFCCITPAREGGETPIADMRNVYTRIDPEIRERFEQKGWMLVRNYGDGCGLPWQKVFHTSDKLEVEAYCRDNNIDFEWKDGDRLKTRQVRRAIAKHPHTGEKVWFNHIAFFHISTREPVIRDALLKEFHEEDLPTNTYYGDGTPIEPQVLDALREVHAQETIVFPWQQGDMLILDNMLVAHGRSPFGGPRKVVVGMADPVPWERV